MSSTSALSLAPGLDPETVRRTVLPNGLTVLVRRDESAPVVAIVTHVKAGYFDETDDVVGIAHVLEHMFFKGTPRRNAKQISEAIEGVGGMLHAYTSYDSTTYYAKVANIHFDRAVDTLGDMLLHSLFDPKEIEKERRVIIEEINMSLDQPAE